MSREILITTPENIAIEYELAGLATRAAAFLMDIAIQVVLWIAIGVIAFVIFGIAMMAGLHQFVRYVSAFENLFEGLYAILGFLILWGYRIYFEIKWNGQTPGKRHLGLRTILQGGYPINAYGATIRNLFWLFDLTPLPYPPGIAFILGSREYQRLGDIVGGTIVVKQRAPHTLDGLLRVAQILPEHLDADALALIMHEADRLTPDEYRAVRHFTERRRQLIAPVQQSAAAIIAIPLMRRLHIVPPASAKSIDYATFLEYLAVAYEQLRRPK